MLKLSGALTVKSIDGRNGVFIVGSLVTPFGEFTVKDPLIEQYQDGKYEGDFGISKIYLVSYVSRGRMTVEIRAKIETIALVSLKISESQVPSQTGEMDPLDEAPPPTPAPEPISLMAHAATQSVQSPPIPPTGAVVMTEDASGPTEAVSSETDRGDADAGLFGPLWPLVDEVKLDPTIDRALFRSQRDRLKALGYTFQPLGQVWLQAA